MQLLHLTLFSVFAVVHSLRCYDGRGSINDNPQNVQPSECISGHSCIKAIDYTGGTFSKGCNTQNCTSATSNYGPEGCNMIWTNVNGASHNVTTCCCYGDLCNSDRSPFVLSTMLLSAVVALIFL